MGSQSLVVSPEQFDAGGGGGFNPETDITWHSLFWAEGTDFVAEGYSNDDDVSPWPNETGESDATQSTASKKPHYKSSVAALNSQPAVDFVAASSQQLATAVFTSNPSYTSGVSIIIIAALDSGNFSYSLVDGIVLANTNTVYGSTTTNDVYIWAGSQQGGTWAEDTDAHMWRAFFDGSTGTDTLHIDETSEVSASAGSNTLTGLTIGSYYSDATYLDGHIAFVGIYEGDITADGEWANFKTWVTDHYGATLA